VLRAISWIKHINIKDLNKKAADLFLVIVMMGKFKVYIYPLVALGHKWLPSPLEYLPLILRCLYHAKLSADPCRWMHRPFMAVSGHLNYHHACHSGKKA
jgi:hypothetical protein